MKNTLHKSIQRIFEVANGLFGLTVFHCLRHAVFDVMFKDDLPYLVEPGTNRRDLGQHVVAFTPLIPKPFEAVGMTGDACEPFGNVLARWIVCQMRHRRHNFPESNLPSPLGG